MWHGEATGSNQAHNTLLSPTNPMRYVPGMGFMYQQHHTTFEEKTSIPPAPISTRYSNFCQGKRHYASTCEMKRKADVGIRSKIVPATNMAKIYLDLKDSLKDDPELHLVANGDKDDRMRDVYIVCIRICLMWSQLYNVPQGKKGVSKDNGFLYKKNERGAYRLVLARTFNLNSKNNLETAINEAHDATAHGGVEKTLKWLTDRFIYQSLCKGCCQ